MMNKINCSVPYKIAFTNSEFGFRNCCSAYPQIKSSTTESFENWWQSSELENFRQQFNKEDFPESCYRCKINEQNSGNSYRTAINKEYGDTIADYSWPQSWNVMFGNICNLGCWTCNEDSSSVIENHKRKLGSLPANYVSSQQMFNQRWKSLQEDILKSYQHHSYVSLTILGGEPLYNKDVVEFLQLLIDQGLSTRTKLEFHTNATIFAPAIQHLLDKDNWKYTVILLSLDAVGKKAEWLRYGCDWEKIVNNISKFKTHADYLQITATVSILNISDLPSLHQFSVEQDIPLTATVIAEPEFMTLESWPGPVNELISRNKLADCGFESFYDLVGSAPDSSAPEKIKKYIQSFDRIRTPMKIFDPVLAKTFGVS